MFRAQANPMDDAVVKASDENLVDEDWQLILDVCDRVAASPSGPQQAVASLIKRLAHRNANVQLHTLTLANALSQNCGPSLHRELASRAFTEALLRLAGDRNTHAQVKQKVLERMGTWTEEFGRAPEFGIMEQAYQKLRTSQPSLLPPSKPGKREISEEDRKKEEKELQEALARSVQDSKTKVNGTSVVEDSNESPSTTQAASAAAQGTTATTVSRVRALYDFTPSEPRELAFKKNDIIAVLARVYKDWWNGSLRGQTGIFPLNYVEKLQDPTKEELERDAQMEAEVFGEIKNVEKLLALLSVRAEGGGAGRRGEREEDEISELYQRTLSIRPRLIELIGKYSQKKDDFTQLNEKFIKARRDYEALLESSMAQPQHYQQYPIRQLPSGQMYQQPSHYGAGQIPPAGYGSQAQPGYGAPYASQNHLPAQIQHHQHHQHHQHQPPAQQPHQQDPAQRYYSPGPQAESAQQYSVSPYTPNPLPAQQSNSAAFHFIPGGVGTAPPAADHQSAAAVKRKPSPQVLTHQHGPSQPPSEMGGTAPSYLPQDTAFQSQIRPNSIHTLNSGNPQELATSGYESPIDNRRSYPPAAALDGQQQGVPGQYTMTPPIQQQGFQYPSYPPPAPTTAAAATTTTAQQRPAQQHTQSQEDIHDSVIPAPLQLQGRSDLSSLPSRQRTDSFESHTSLHSAQHGSSSTYPPAQPTQAAPLPPHQLQHQQQQPHQYQQPAQHQHQQPQYPHQQPPQHQHQQHPSMSLPDASSSPPLPQYAYQPYQAYQPHAQQQPAAALGNADAVGDDPGDYYR